MTEQELKDKIVEAARAFHGALMYGGSTKNSGYYEKRANLIAAVDQLQERMDKEATP